ncbi:MAG: hypothetical protein M1374_07205 [Firmicutes bacterium]|nr:hypothetical protein [Bacillota bacterium]
MKKYLLAFVKFWYNFLVGDTPEFFVVTLVVVAIGITTHRQSQIFILSTLIFISLVFGVSLYRGRQKNT